MKPRRTLAKVGGWVGGWRVGGSRSQWIPRLGVWLDVERVVVVVGTRNEEETMDSETFHKFAIDFQPQCRMIRS